MKLKAIAILAIIIFSLLPVYYMNRYLQQIIRPRENMRRMFLCLLALFSLIFVYTFLLVFVIRMVFPGA